MKSELDINLSKVFSFYTVIYYLFHLKKIKYFYFLSETINLYKFFRQFYFYVDFSNRKCLGAFISNNEESANMKK